MAKGSRLKSAKARHMWGTVQEGSKCEASHCHFPVESWTALVFFFFLFFSAVMCDNIQGALPSREAYLSHGVQSSYWGLASQTWLAAFMANL